jgi:hypothetical protein
MRRSSRLRPALAALALVALVAGCELGQVTVAAPRAQLVVHSVLNPGARTQWVLVERTLTGTVTIPEDARFDPNDPIRSGSGVPVSGAIVTVTGADGLVLRGVEERAPTTRLGTGVYRLDLPNAAHLRPGERYTLRVQAADGGVVTGSTRIPSVAPVAAPTTTERFDRERDTVVLRWGGVPDARSYALRVDSPYGPFFLFVDSLSMRLPGSLRNLFGDRLPRVFVPGFQQDVTVSAIDTNYFDYYRSRNDPFTGSGIINRLEGGIGLFGSVVNVVARSLDVTAPLRAPIDGSYERASGPVLVSGMRLWVESPAVAGKPASLSGSWHVDTLDTGHGLLGTLDGTRVQLVLLSGQLASDTLTVFTGDVRADSLVGSLRGVAQRVVFRKIDVTGPPVRPRPAPSPPSGYRRFRHSSQTP